jgi:NADP-dependent 3-hydroxy acid dehydrogenase YdfG
MGTARTLVRDARRVSRTPRSRHGDHRRRHANAVLLERFPDLDPAKLQDPRDVARAVRFALTQPRESVVAEITVLPVQETSWP